MSKLITCRQGWLHTSSVEKAALGEVLDAAGFVGN
jgi:hypothetical protein